MSDNHVLSDNRCLSACLHCALPLPSTGSNYHKECRERVACAICGASGLTFACTEPRCHRVVHAHCVSRISALQDIEFRAVSCQEHSSSKGKNKELSLCREVAQELCLNSTLLASVKRELARGRPGNSGAGSVFWYVLGSAYFPNYCVSLPPPEFPLRPPAQCTSALQQHSLLCALELVSSDLQAVQHENEALWGSLPQYPGCKASRQDQLLQEIRMQSVNREYLRLLQTQLKGKESSSLQTHKKTLTRSYSKEEEFHCSVCGDEDYDDDDLLIICSRCNVYVHQQCYGVARVPEADWYCDACVQCPGRALRCALCPVSGGALKLTVNTTAEFQCKNYPFTGEQEAIWCHVFCLTQLAKHCATDSLQAVDPKAFIATCSVCGTRNGACLRCAQRKCLASFHPECGKHLFLNTRDKTGYDKVELYCDAHKPFALRRRVEAKDKRAVDEILEFCKTMKKLQRNKGQLRDLRRKKGVKLSLEEKFAVFEWVEELIAAPSNKFLFAFKGTNVKGRLRSKVEVTRPERYTILDPAALLTGNLRLFDMKGSELHKFYLEEIYPIMREELKVLRAPCLPCKAAVRNEEYDKAKKVSPSNVSEKTEVDSLDDIECTGFNE